MRKHLQACKSLLKHPQFPARAFHMDKAVRQGRWGKVVKALNRREFALREEIAKCVDEQSDEIDPKKGFLVLDLADNAGVQAAIAYARQVVEEMRDPALAGSSKKSFKLGRRLSLDQDSLNPVFELTRSGLFLSIISRYLGSFPALLSANVWYSPNTEFVGSSQLFHIDGVDQRQVKVFVFLEPVTEESGPLTVIPADATERCFAQLQSSGTVKQRPDRVTDDQMTALGDQPGIPLTGPAGTVAFVDTCRCYHFGSRPGNRPRAILMLQFTSAACIDLPVVRNLIPAELELAAKQQRLLFDLYHTNFAAARRLRNARSRLGSPEAA